MSSIDLQHLVQRMSVPVRASLEGAAALAVRHTHDVIELHHWLGALALDASFRELLESVGVSSKNFADEVGREVNTLPRGQGGTPAFSGNVISLARESWLATSLGGGRSRVAFADLLMVLADDASLRSLSRALAPSLRTLDGARLAGERTRIEAGEATSGEGAVRSAASTATGEDFLALYTQDMTAEAEAGRIDPVVGREDELRQVIDILLRRRQNNPILVGEAGVGKTAVAEAFALRLAAGEVPEKLAGTRLLSLDLSLLQAGAGVKGEFERRLTGVVEAVKRSAVPVILFIDEAHGLVGAGNQPGQGDAANILKPALARGELRTVAATTWGEYKRYIERDAALTRRFQPVKVGEPDEETAVRMLRGVVDILQRHHGVRIRDEALRAAVQLSARYIPARQLPDKAVSLIDTAAASVAFGRAGEPAALEDARREREHLELEAARLEREPGSDETAERRAAIAERLPVLAAEIDALEARLGGERDLILEADRLEKEIAAGEGEASHAAFREVAGRLAEAQGDGALVHRVVDAEAVAAVVARWTGVPLGRLVSDQLTAVNQLGSRLKSRIVGQDDALDRLAAAMRVARARLSDPRRPTGVFLMVGMSGVGKTETALALADILYGGPQSLTTINMSEFKEEHKVSMLLGSPPGYVGYGEGGVLTEAVRRRPYGVLLLDEIDKAHPGVQDVFYQLFDKGTIRDGEGRDIDFRNTLVLMTANTGSDVLQALAADPDTMPEGDALAAVLKNALLAEFKPAFLGRTVILPYRPLGPEALEGIVDLQIRRVVDRLEANYGASLDLTPGARDALVAQAAAGNTGARAIETAIARDLLPVLSSFFLDATIAGHKPRAVVLDHLNGAFEVVSGPHLLAAQAVGPDPSPELAPSRWREAV